MMNVKMSGLLVFVSSQCGVSTDIPIDSYDVESDPDVVAVMNVDVLGLLFG